MLLKACLTCGEPSPATRCPPCQTVNEQQRGNSAERGYDRQWRTKAARVIRANPECVLCGSTHNLSADHIIPKALGGTDLQLQTLCRRCNSSKGARQ